VPRRFAAGVTGAGVSSGDADVDVAVVDVRGDDVIDGIGPTFLPVATGLGVDDTVAIQVDQGGIRQIVKFGRRHRVTGPVDRVDVDPAALGKDRHAELFPLPGLAGRRAVERLAARRDVVQG